ncbi:MAG: DNA-3-methyladenine glycosylase, partial [Bacillales bacterium]
IILTDAFFAREPLLVAQDLLGKVLRHYHKGLWLSAMIIETEAYYLAEKGSHSSLGFTEKRKALFMAPGTLYMYYARGGDSLNISCLGEGNAVLLKSGIPYFEDADPHMLDVMMKLNPIKNNGKQRKIEKLCSLIHHFIFVKVRLLQENHEERNFIMEFIASIFILTGFIGLFIGAKGLLTGKIQFLNIFSRKKSGQFLALMFVVMIVGGALMPTDPIEDTKDDEAQTEEIAGSETKKPNGQEEEKNNTEDRADENEEVNGEKDKTDEANSEQNDNTEQAANAEQSETLHGELEVHFVDVGQGHAQVIVTPNHRVMVIDGGNNDDEDDMVAYLKQLGVERVDILIGTHPDADHI